MADHQGGQPGGSRPASDFDAYWQRLRPLGELRCRVLACMSAHNPRVPAYFDPPATRPLHDALRNHLQQLYSRYESDSVARLFPAAGLLTFGQLEMAEVVLQSLPAEAVRLDHGAGWCRLLPYRVVADLLPLPEELRDPVQWVEGTPQAEALRSWFARQRDRLRWDPDAERFIDH
jgi:hypothetical protein